MASPYVLSNEDLQYIHGSGQDFNVYLAFLNPVSVTTTWNDLNMDADGNWLPPANLDTLSAGTVNAPYGPVVNMGPNRIGFVGETLYFDGSLSYRRFDTALPPTSFSWSTTGPATVTSYGSQVGVSWGSPGIYTVSLTISYQRALFNYYYMGPTFSMTTTRQVCIYQDRQSALPGVIGISGLSGSLSTGGWQMQCTTTNSQVSLLAPDSLPPGTYQPVVLLGETRYEVTPGQWVTATIGANRHFNPGNPYKDPRILFDGYIQNGTIHQDIDKDTLSFSCAGPQMILQEAKTHMLGYYSSQVTGLQTLTPSPVGNGFLVGGLTTADVLHSLLQDHTSIAQYHDIHIWNATIPIGPYSTTATNASYINSYTTLSINEGTIWQNMQDLATNEYSQCYCERDGSICVGPQINYRGGDSWQIPTMSAASLASTCLNYLFSDYGIGTGGDFTAIEAQVKKIRLDAADILPYFIHSWGPQALPQPYMAPFSSQPNAQMQQTQASLTGPPILCHFTDTPIYDTSLTPPDTSGILFPWIAYNWPQMIGVVPLSFDIQENYTGRAALVKLIGTLYGHTTLWTSWYPRETFQLVGDGTVSVVSSVLPASDWVLNEQHVLGDITTSTNALLVWNWWWEIAKREYYARNTNYTAQVTLPMFLPPRLGDIVALTRQQVTLGPHFNNKMFTVQEINHALDLSARTWMTTLSLAEVTSNSLPPIEAPPNSPPTG